ncbi:MAG: iron chelate uptake ABC transporter family permease subunit, partial [Chloroflexota bacterium]|nr:iron chelate uptake ABC transporter family permease subunit [Chloroflexota bacterium]
MSTIELDPGRRPGFRTIHSPYYALRLNVRVIALSMVALGALALLAIWAISLGSYQMDYLDVLRAIAGRGSEDQLFVVRTIRLPRTICAVMIGAALAMSGAIFQGLVRNPLVSPDIIGINSGASLVAVIWIIYGLNGNLLPVAAFIGAIVTATIIYLLAWKQGIAPGRLILVGIGVGAAVSAATQFVTIRFPVEIVRPATVWIMGSVYATSWNDVIVITLSLAGLSIAAVVLARSLRVLQLGDDLGRGLGLSLERTRLSLIVVGCGLSAVAVAIAGPIGFVALMIPHMARILAGPVSGTGILFTGILGGCFLLGADVIANHFLPVTLPVGVVTAAVGAPYFLFLLYRSRLG